VKIWIKIVVSIILSAVLLYFVDWRQTIGYLIRINPAPAISAVGILSLNFFISSYKWKILLEAKGYRLRLWELTRCYWKSSFFGNYLPTNFGGDVFRVVMLNKVVRSTDLAASIVWERVTGFVVLLFWSALGLIMRPQFFAIGSIYILLWISIVAGIFAFFCLLFFGSAVIKVMEKIKNCMSGNFARLLGKMINIAEAITSYRNDKKEIFLALVFSIPFYIVVIISNLLVLRSVGSDMPLIEIIYVAPVVPLVSLLPISLNGLGVSESAYVLFYTQAWLLPSVALAAAVIRRLSHLLISLVGGIFFITDRSSA
jgi:uncharacterized protein (TIRG00374 family)